MYSEFHGADVALFNIEIKSRRIFIKDYKELFDYRLKIIILIAWNSELEY